MDENYLDSLLNKVSSDQTKPNNNFDNTVEQDSGIDIDMSDLDNISLDELDDLDSLDLGDLDLDDIDFDDIDITSLDSGKVQEKVQTNAKSVQEEDFSLDELISETLEEEIGIKEPEPKPEPKPELKPESKPEPVEVSAPVNEDVFSDAEMQFTEDTESMDLDDLFSALGIEEENSDSGNNNPYTSNQDSLDDLFEASMMFGAENGELDGIEDIGDVKPTKKKLKKSKNKKSNGEPKAKRNIAEVLFGEPDEDDREEEKLLEQKKAEQEVKNAAKKEQLAVKQGESQRKKKDKDDKKKAKDEALRVELEAEKNEKKVSTPTVIIVFASFVALAVVVVFGAKLFNYSQVIKKASDYFNRQKYRLAYEEVSGVEVKEKDEDLRDRIYTVMYVERLYESYQNNLTLSRPDKALDALLRGLEKYDEHYDEAVELGVAADIDMCKGKIINALWNAYGLSENQAYDIMQLTGQEYTQTLYQYCKSLEAGE